MGGTTFCTTATGKNVHEAFLKARDEALYEHGHGGYTGTIAEKDQYLLCDPFIPEGMNVYELIRALEDQEQDKVPLRVWTMYDDKWGPCVAFTLQPVKGQGYKYAFLGWASC